MTVVGQRRPRAQLPRLLALVLSHFKSGLKPAQHQCLCSPDLSESEPASPRVLDRKFLEYGPSRHGMAQMTQTPPCLLPFVLAVSPVDPVVDDTIDWYLPPGDARAPGGMSLLRRLLHPERRLGLDGQQILSKLSAKSRSEFVTLWRPVGEFAIPCGSSACVFQL
jgi:hypothetical protein